MTKEVSNDIIEQYGNLVKYIAVRVCANNKDFPIDERVSVGFAGLCEAYSRYNSEIGGFNTFAYERIKGAILDEARRIGRFSHGIANDGKALDEAEEQWRKTYEDEPTSKDLATYLDWPIEKVHDTKRVYQGTIVSLELPVINQEQESIDIGDSVADMVTETPDEVALANERKELLQSVIETLKPEDKEIIHQYFVEGLTLKEIGKNHMYSESRASQLKSTVIEKIKDKIRNTDYFS